MFKQKPVPTGSQRRVHGSHEVEATKGPSADERKAKCGPSAQGNGTRPYNGRGRTHAAGGGRWPTRCHERSRTNDLASHATDTDVHNGHNHTGGKLSGGCRGPGEGTQHGTGDGHVRWVTGHGTFPSTTADAQQLTKVQNPLPGVRGWGSWNQGRKPTFWGWGQRRKISHFRPHWPPEGDFPPPAGSGQGGRTSPCGRHGRESAAGRNQTLSDCLLL